MNVLLSLINAWTLKQHLLFIHKFVSILILWLIYLIVLLNKKYRFYYHWQTCEASHGNPFIIYTITLFHATFYEIFIFYMFVDSNIYEREHIKKIVLHVYLTKIL